MYVQIDRDLAIAWRYYKVPPPSPLAGLTSMEFVPELFFVCLCSEALDEVIVSGLSVCKKFIAGGLALVPAAEGRGPGLKHVEFECCYVVSHMVRGRVSEQIKSGQQAPDAYVVASEEISVTPNDLWLSDEDIAEIRDRELTAGEVVKYPFEHRAEFPAIYGMFQAAYRANTLGYWSKKEIGDWLREKLGRSLMTDGRRDTAAKFVRLKLDRSKGKHIAPFDLAAVGDHFPGAEVIDQPYLSDGMKLILAATQWWFDQTRSDLSPSRLAFAKTLVELNFREAEAIDLTYLISGAGLDPLEKEKLAAFARM